MNTNPYSICCYKYKTLQYSPFFYYDITTGLAVKDAILLGFQAFPQIINKFYK